MYRRRISIGSLSPQRDKILSRRESGGRIGSHLTIPSNQSRFFGWLATGRRIATYGSNDSDVFSFDANTERETSTSLTSNGQSDIGMLTWNANGSLKQLADYKGYSSELDLVG